MIEREFESLCGGCNFYLYTVIFNEKEWRKEKKREEEKREK